MDEKRKLLGNFEKILKIFDENSIEKLNFYFILFLFFILFFENLLLKIEPSEITPVFYNNFFGFGGGISPFPPGYALAYIYKLSSETGDLFSPSESGNNWIEINLQISLKGFG